MCCTLLLLLQVMVFSWSGCPFCKNAKALLSDLGADFTALELDTIGQEGKQIRAELAVVS
jgi:glutaredoxin